MATFSVTGRMKYGTKLRVLNFWHLMAQIVCSMCLSLNRWWTTCVVYHSNYFCSCHFRFSAVAWRPVCSGIYA